MSEKVSKKLSNISQQANEAQAIAIKAERFNFETPIELADALACRVAIALTKAIAQDGAASLAVSGGQTPALFFRQLAQKDIDWQYVTITLVDERYVPLTSERSNEKFLYEHLLCGHVKKARFVGLYSQSMTAELAAFTASNRVATIMRPFSAVILGMGEDGHTASFFPKANRLAQALDPKTNALIVAIRAKSVPEPRLTMALPLLISAKFIALHIEGHKKLTILEKALKEQKSSTTPLPVYSLLKEAKTNVNIYWSPTAKEIANDHPEEPLLTGLLSVNNPKPQEQKERWDEIDNAAFE